MMSMSPADLMLRRAALAILESAAERDAVERKSRCGRACDLADFESRRAELAQERIE
jgi:hypothetical protein